jgi:DNA-binding GntR family transcriptional regulator
VSALAGAELAYERIREAIVEGRYEPGRRLVEARVAEELDLSRTPVREAIRRLDAEGLVVTERNRGAVVRELSVEDVRDLYELRIRLESYAAELAATRIAPLELVQLEADVDRFSALVAKADGTVGSLRQLGAANRAIHDRIVDASHHQRLGAMLRRAVDIPLVFRAFRSFGRSELERSDLFHRLIASAIEQRDGRRAGRLMAEHIAQGLDAVLTSMHEKGNPTTG